MVYCATGYVDKNIDQILKKNNNLEDMCCFNISNTCYY